MLGRCSHSQAADDLLLFEQAHERGPSRGSWPCCQARTPITNQNCVVHHLAILAGDGAWKFSRANPASFPVFLPTFFPELAAGLIKFSLWDAESMQTQITQSVPSLPTNGRR